jgi:hypothetical protein
MVFKNEKINSKNEINNLNNDALVLVKMSKLNEAFALFNNALKQNFLDFTAETGAKCCKYWDTRINKIIFYR